MSRNARAEAVAWLARLQAAGRDRAAERGLKRWLAASAENAAEFERATDTWEELGGVPTAALLRRNAKPQAHRSFPRWAAVAAGMSALMGLFVAIWLALWPSDSDISTRVGEQRMVTLSDGSRITLNTDSRVTVPAWDAVREVRLERGEAYFEVARNPIKPFVVVAGGKKVVAIGTAFAVRRQIQNGNERISVTMVEGKVAVTDREVTPPAGTGMPNHASTLVAGQRLVLAKSGSSPAQIDRPRIDAVTAWRRGEVVLDNTALKDAVVEMNRYNAIALAVDDESTTGNIPVSGIFRAGDSESFATAVATLYGLSVVKGTGTLTLSENAAPRI